MKKAHIVNNKIVNVIIYSDEGFSVPEGELIDYVQGQTEIGYEKQEDGSFINPDEGV